MRDTRPVPSHPLAFVAAAAALPVVLCLAGLARPSWGQSAAPGLPGTGGTTTPGSTSGFGTAAKPLLVLKADKGFIDDPVAIDSEGGRLAILRTDSASFARLQILNLETGAVRHQFQVGDPQQQFERLMFAGDADGGVVLVTRDPENERRSAQHYGVDGKPRGHAGPVTDFGITSRGGQAQLVGWDRRKLASGGTTYVLTRYRLDGLMRAGKQQAYTADRAGALARPPLKLLGWQDGYAQIVGQRAGAYDKAKDFRQPDRAAVIDALDGGTTVIDAELRDPLAWVAANQLRNARPNRSLFAVVTDQQDALRLFDALGRQAALELAAPFPHYDPRTLTEQEDPATRTLFFSLATDALHPAALARRKVDQLYLDIYRVAVPASGIGTATTTRIVRAALDDRPPSWLVAGRFAAVLRKHKSFSRGGTQLEIYRVSPEAQ